MTPIRKLELRRSIIITIKYALATVVALRLASLLAPLDLLSCGFVALLTLQPTLYGGLRSSLDQVKATTVATSITVLIVFALRPELALGPSYLQAGLAMGLTAMVCIRFFPFEVTATALFTVLYLSLMPALLQGSFWDTILLRYVTILIGIGTSTSFNLLFSLLRHKDRLHVHLVSTSAQIRDLFLELEEALCGLEEPPTPARLQGFLTDFRKVFASLSRVQAELDELEQELFRGRRRGRDSREPELDRLRLAFSRKMSNIAHYGWNMVLVLLLHPLDRSCFGELTSALPLIVLEFRRAHRSLELLQRSEAAGPALADLVQRIGETVQQRDRASSDRSVLACVTLLSDLLHLQLNVREHSDNVQRYVALLAQGGEAGSATADAAPRGPGDAA